MRKIYLFIILIFLCFAYSAYAQFPKYLYGIVSWYGDEFAGKKTASGEYYDPQAYTAAHRTLPFGTELEVENLDNGHRVKVKINDRGPMVNSRVLDISKKAADELGILQSGTANAKITLIRVGNGKVREMSPKPDQSTEAPVSNTPAPASELPTPAVSTPAPTAPVIAPVPPAVLKNKEVTTTNYAVVVVTNSYTMTNQYSVPVSNIVNVPPYEDKIVENDLSNNIIPPVKEADGFVMDEPQEIPPIAASDNKAIKFKEDEVTPETLLTNEVPVHMEQKNNKGEAFVDSAGNMAAASGAASGYVVQVGAFKKESHALSLYDSLKKKGFNVFTTESQGKKGSWIRVRVGYFDSLSKANEALDKLKAMKLKGAIIKVK